MLLSEGNVSYRQHTHASIVGSYSCLASRMYDFRTRNHPEKPRTLSSSCPRTRAPFTQRCHASLCDLCKGTASGALTNSAAGHSQSTSLVRLSLDASHSFRSWTSRHDGMSERSGSRCRKKGSLRDSTRDGGPTAILYHRSPCYPSNPWNTTNLAHLMEILFSLLPLTVLVRLRYSITVSAGVQPFPQAPTVCPQSLKAQTQTHHVSLERSAPPEFPEPGLDTASKLLRD
jgi:hypothetical protein